MYDNQPNDTAPEIEAIIIAGYRAMTASQKLHLLQDQTLAVQRLALASIRRRHPDADEREQMLRLASRWLEPDLLLQASGWDVRKEGY